MGLSPSRETLKWNITNFQSEVNIGFGELWYYISNGIKIACAGRSHFTPHFYPQIPIADRCRLSPSARLPPLAGHFFTSAPAPLWVSLHPHDI